MVYTALCRCPVLFAMSSQQLIANELLAFVQNAVDTMDEVSIRQICKSSFSEDDICSGKALLFQTLGKTDQMPSRRRDGGVKSLQDIIKLFKETDPDDVPAFVAKRLDRLPPVTFDHVDVTRLLKDITFLKTSLAEVQAKLEVSNNTISELRSELALLRSAHSECRSDTSNIAVCHVAQNVSIGGFEPANLDASAIAEQATADPRPAARPSTSPETRTSRESTLIPKRSYASTAAKPPAVSKPKQRPKKGVQSLRDPVHKDQSQPTLRESRCDEDGFKKVEKRRKPARQNQCGTAPTGPNHLLRPATPSTLLYVSRLHYLTKVDDIVKYVKTKTGFILRVAKLESRHNANFNSFVVSVPTDHLATFTKEEFWPKGVKFRRFRGRLPDTAGLRNAS
ncbi:uncharacterized protein LOC134792331, partial [Cydia splendana]|uniref:uncharacterized protein LOC134792331 n=1 Tax=Cydia splendana TaxID=1100963 RepID=UPI00300C477E